MLVLRIERQCRRELRLRLRAILPRQRDGGGELVVFRSMARGFCDHAEHVRGEIRVVQKRAHFV